MIRIYSTLETQADSRPAAMGSQKAEIESLKERLEITTELADKYEQLVKQVEENNRARLDGIRMVEEIALMAHQTELAQMTCERNILKKRQIGLELRYEGEIRANNGLKNESRKLQTELDEISALAQGRMVETETLQWEVKIKDTIIVLLSLAFFWILASKK